MPAYYIFEPNNIVLGTLKNLLDRCGVQAKVIDGIDLDIFPRSSTLIANISRHPEIFENIVKRYENFTLPLGFACALSTHESEKYIDRVSDLQKRGLSVALFGRPYGIRDLLVQLVGVNNIPSTSPYNPIPALNPQFIDSFQLYENTESAPDIHKNSPNDSLPPLFSVDSTLPPLQKVTSSRFNRTQNKQSASQEKNAPTSGPAVFKAMSQKQTTVAQNDLPVSKPSMMGLPVATKQEVLSAHDRLTVDDLPIIDVEDEFYPVYGDSSESPSMATSLTTITSPAQLKELLDENNEPPESPETLSQRYKQTLASELILGQFDLCLSTPFDTLKLIASKSTCLCLCVSNPPDEFTIVFDDGKLAWAERNHLCSWPGALKFMVNARFSEFINLAVINNLMNQGLTFKEALAAAPNREALDGLIRDFISDALMKFFELKTGSITILPPSSPLVTSALRQRPHLRIDFQKTALALARKSKSVLAYNRALREKTFVARAFFIPFNAMLSLNAIESWTLHRLKEPRALKDVLTAATSADLNPDDVELAFQRLLAFRFVEEVFLFPQE